MACRIIQENSSSCRGRLKKAASGVLAIFLCSRTGSTLRAKKWLWPSWTDFFEPTQRLWYAKPLWANLPLKISIIQHSLQEKCIEITGKDA